MSVPIDRIMNHVQVHLSTHLGENFEGWTNRECGVHNSGGPHSAWCTDCKMYCRDTVAEACLGCQNWQPYFNAAALIVNQMLLRHHPITGRDGRKSCAVCILKTSDTIPVYAPWPCEEVELIESLGITR